MALSGIDRGTVSLAWTGSPTSTTTITSASFTPAANALLLIAYVGLAENTSWTVSASSTHSGTGSWTYVDQTITAFSAYRFRVTFAYAFAGASPGAGTVSMVRSAGSYAFAAQMSVLEISGADPTNPIRNSATNSGSSVSSLTTTLAATPRSDSWVYAMVGDLYGSITDPSGYTSLREMAAGDVIAPVVYDTTSASISQAWTALGSNYDVAAAIEVQVVQAFDGTATPAAIALAATMPAVTAGSFQTAAPDVIALAADLPQVVIAGGSTAAPAAIALAATMDPVAAAATATATPAAIALAAALPAVTPSASSVATPDRIALAVMLNTPQIFIDGIPVFALLARDVSDADLLDLVGVSVRTDAILFELLDVGGNVIGEVHPEFAKAGITNETTQGIKRKLSGLVFPPDELAAIDTLSDRLRVKWVLENGSVYPLGTFLWADDRRRRYSFGLIAEQSMVDQGLILDQPLSASLGWAAGTLVRDAMVQTIEAAGITNYLLDLTTATIGSDVAYPASQSNSYAKVLDYLCGIAGFHPAYFDNTGVLRARVVPDISVAVPTLVYGATTDDAARIISGSMVESNDLLGAPNRYLVVDTSITGGAVVATYDLPASAPHSIARRGFAIPKVLEVAGVGNIDQALEYARAFDASTPKAYETASWSGPADPRHDTFDLVTYRGVTFVELGWRLPLSPGGPMDHTAQRVFV